jgi:hypothetical protein
VTDISDPQPAAEADADTVANRAAQVITSMGADIRALTGERDRYRGAWRSARERAQAYGEGILRVVKDREQYQEWLRQAEERAAAMPAAPVAAPPTGQTELVKRVAAALTEHGMVHLNDPVLTNEYDCCAEAALAVLPAPVDRAAVLREAADDLATAFGDPKVKHIGAIAASHLRRRARKAEAEQATESKPETPLEKRLRYSERRNDELRTECRRRGSNVLEQSEKNRVLERQIDSIREQLGAEILRAGEAEAELRRLAAEAPGPETQGAEPWLTDSARIGRTLIWSWADVGKGAFREGYRAAQAEARALLGGERGTDQQPPAVVAEPGKET